jgi:hypothetical protein
MLEVNTTIDVRLGIPCEDEPLNDSEVPWTVLHIGKSLSPVHEFCGEVRCMLIRGFDNTCWLEQSVVDLCWILLTDFIKEIKGIWISIDVDLSFFICEDTYEVVLYNHHVWNIQIEFG